jgi:hypothetical protein
LLKAGCCASAADRGQHHFGVAGDVDGAARASRLVMRTRRSSMSSSGETAISVCTSISWSRRPELGASLGKIAS